MRTVIRTLATTVALVVAFGAVAVGQSPASGMVTIEASQIELTSPGVMTPNADRTTYLEQGREMTMALEASDPRLTGEVACAGNRLVNRDGSFVEAETFVITNDGGRWIGQSTGHVLAGPPPDIVVGIWPASTGPDHRDVVALRGEGGYEGLSAVISADWLAVPPLVTGAIFEGALPSAPELTFG